MPSLQQLVENFDWASTPIGPRHAWPQSLRTSVSICLASRFPILVWWGPDLTMIYNDAYRPFLGDKHPRSLGAAGRSVWGEIWPVIGPLLDQVRYEGKATWSDDQLLMMNRHGFLEETYFTFSYSPILDESGGVGGIFTAVTETTHRVIGERRLETLRKLAASANQSKTVEAACHNAAAIAATNPLDLPYAAIEIRDDERCNVQTGNAASAKTIEVPLIVPGESESSGRLIAGISPHLAFDDAYRNFMALVGGHIGGAIGNAKAYEMERERAESLAELDRAKTAFFSNVSHEFRTPLTLMLGPLEDVLEIESLPSEARDHIEVAHRNALRLLKLVNTLLDFSRIEAGRIEAVYEPIDLARYTSDLASVFRSAIERAGLQFVIDCNPLDELVYVDREMWEKIVLNLVSNALKFTFDGQIEVSLRRDGSNAVLSVRDTGTGISEEEVPHLFERFYRVRNARSRTHEGSGIGLALVQELARLMGGTVSVDTQLGSGSTFTVTVPFGSAHLPADRVGTPRTLASTAPIADAWREEALRWTGDELAMSAAGSSYSRDSARILVADDNADMRQYVQRLLGARYDVEAVADGAAALEAARRRTPDVIIADVMMPNMDGFELLKTIRGDERLRNLAVILLSARAGEEARVEGLDSGADDYLVKPFSAKELLARVDAHLRLQRVRREAQEALRASEVKFSTAFDRSPLALTITSLETGRFVEVNEAFVRFSGFSRDETIGRSPEDLGLWLEPEKRRERLAQLRNGIAVPDIESRFRIKSGEERIGMIGAARVDINGRPCILNSLLDITERKRAEEALRESEARFREFADAAPATLWITEPDGSCSFLSRGWRELTGQTSEEALGWGWTTAIHPDDRTPVHDAFLAANEKREPFSLDCRVRAVDGTYRWIIASGRPRFGASGEYLGFVGSVIDITDRKRAEQSKDEFLATLSHELRTPLTSGYGWIKLLGKTRDSELLETGLHALEQSLVNQMKLIDDLLDVSRIAAGKIFLDIQPLDLTPVIGSALEMVRPAAAAKSIDLSARLQPMLPVQGDGARLKQVFWNILTNAIKFTPPGGSVEVDAHQRGAAAVVTIRDTGEGIDPLFVPHVFQPFRQQDSSTTRRHGGLGIGLSIVSSLVSAHGGSVRAASDGINKGSTFIVTIPLLQQKDVALPPSIVQTDREQRIEGARVLVVDDDSAARRIMSAVLSAAGAEVREFTNVGDAFEAITKWQPHIVISDLAMPNEDGYSLIRRIRDTGSRVPAVAITAYARPEDQARVRAAGFQRHVAKPFDPAELVRVVRELAP